MSTSSPISLASLIQQATAAVAEKDSLKASRKRLQDTDVSAQERAELAQSIARMELSREWIAQADVALFNLQSCECCGSEGSSFTGLFQRQHSRVSKIDRWVRVASHEATSSLPREVKVTEESVEMCADCAHLSGYKEI